MRQMPARLALVLLGLLVVAGIVHSPLHDAGAACPVWMLCSGASPLLLTADAPPEVILARAGWVQIAPRTAAVAPRLIPAVGRSPPL